MRPTNVNPTHITLKFCDHSKSPLASIAHQHVHTNTKSKSFGGDYANHCFARFGYPLWTPISQQLVNCGRIIWNCQSNTDCALNGKCMSNSGNCSCNTGWKGYKCGYLDLEAVDATAGYIVANDSDHNNKPTSSWGGSVIVSTKGNWTNDTKYHMFVTEFDNHCGLASWTINSVLSHAISTNGFNSAFQRVEVVHSHFAAEPHIIRGNNGEYVLYYSTYNYTQSAECHCSDGSTPPGCKVPDPAQYTTVMQYAGQNHAPYNAYFSAPLVVFSKGFNDTDLGGVINSDAEFIGMMRRNNASTGSEIHLVTAANWKDAHTYKQQTEIMFPELSALLAEDPFLWIDCSGNYHALFHNMSPYNEQQICGGHAFSSDGKKWIYGGVSYGNSVKYVNGTTRIFSRRESPHLIFADDDCTPIGLTNGVQADGGQWADSTFTLLQPLKQH